MKTAEELKQIPITDSSTYITMDGNFAVFNYKKYSEYLLEQCQKRDELIEAQNELIKFITTVHEITISSSSVIGKSYSDILNELESLRRI